MSDSKQNDSKQNGITTQPLPASNKVHVHSHYRPDISVPMRAITVSSAQPRHGAGGNGHVNPPLMVYDTSGPYTDPNVEDRHTQRVGTAAFGLD